MDSGQEQNYWPAFVDALSNVVLTLVFVLVIFVFALMLASSKVEKKMQEISKQQDVQKTTTELQESQKTVAIMRQQITQMTVQIQKMQQDKFCPSDEKAAGTNDNGASVIIDNKPQGQAKQGFLAVEQSEKGLTLNYPDSTVDIDAKAADKVRDLIAPVQKSVGASHRIILKSFIGKEGYSAARRMAYYRVIGVRNLLITKAGETPENISSVIIQPPQPEDGRVQIVFEKK